MRSLLRAGAAAGLLCLPLAGCSAGADQPGGGGDRPRSVAVTSYRGLPSGVAPPSLPALPSAVAVLQPGDRLALTFWGSSSCPAVPVGTEVVSRHEVRVAVDNHYSGACTADYGPTTSVVQLDGARVDTSSALTVTLAGLAGAPASLIARPGPR